MPIVVTFETLREVQRKERQSEKLAELGDEFYSATKDYFERATKRDTNEARNARSILDDIIDRREKKILNRALSSVRLRERADLKEMSSKEKELFEKLVYLLKDFREGTNTNIAEIEIKKEPQTEKIVVQEKEKPADKNYVKITILEDIPEIVGADLKDYGPFRSGELVNLPRENADLFIKNGKAKPTKTL